MFPEIVLIYGRISLPSPDHGGIPNLQGASEPLTPSTTQLGGGFMMCPGATLFIGEPTCQHAWQALALGGSGNPFTVMEQG